MTNRWRFRVSAASATLGSALQKWSLDRQSGLSGRCGTGVVWWVSVSTSDFRARYERLRFFVDIRGRVIEVEPGQSEVYISVGLEPVVWLLVTILAIMCVTVGLRPFTPLRAFASLGALLLVGVVGVVAWVGAHEFVNSKLIPGFLSQAVPDVSGAGQRPALSSRRMGD